MDEQVRAAADLEIGVAELAARAVVENGVVHRGLKADDAQGGPADLRGGQDDSPGHRHNASERFKGRLAVDHGLGGVRRANLSRRDDGLGQRVEAGRAGRHVEGDADEPANTGGRLGSELQAANAIDQGAIDLVLSIEERVSGRLASHDRPQ